MAQFSKSDHLKVYRLPFKITKAVMLQMFEYKILQNILPTQASLYRDGIQNNDRCTLCKREEQTIDHLLVWCNKTASF